MSFDNEVSLVGSLYSLLVDFVDRPFKITREQGKKILSLMVSQKKLPKVHIDYSPICFFYKDILIFSVTNADKFSFETESLIITSQNSKTVLERI